MEKVCWLYLLIAADYLYRIIFLAFLENRYYCRQYIAGFLHLRRFKGVLQRIYFPVYFIFSPYLRFCSKFNGLAIIFAKICKLCLAKNIYIALNIIRLFRLYICRNRKYRSN